MHTQENEQARWFAEEVQRHEGALRVYLRNHFPTVDHDDIVQESYMRLLQARQTAPIVSARAYLFTVARNAALAVFRSRNSRREISVNELDPATILASTEDVHATANLHSDLELVADAIDELPARCREILTLRVLQGLSHHDIAMKLDLSEATVRVQIMRGLLRCTQYLRTRRAIP